MRILYSRRILFFSVTLPRLLFIGSLDVAPTFGGPIQFHRHFVERDDFVFHKIVEQPQQRLAYLQTGLKWFDSLTFRASQTRFFPHFVALNEWFGIKKSVPMLIREAKQFRPDAIVTVAHGCYCFAAVSVAARLEVPLITFFYDWWPDLSLQSRPGIMAFDLRFRRLYRRSDLAFCVCEEMKAELGRHPNSRVLNPIPSGSKTIPMTEGERKRPRLIYLGGMTRGYGRMISSLCQEYAALQTERPWELAVFGDTKDWPPQAAAEASASGVYRGKRFGSAAREELGAADIFLVIMDFESENRRRVRTSFPSKLLDSCGFGKPIVIWAPEYSSVARFARRSKLGLIHADPTPLTLIERIDSLVRDPVKMSNSAAESAKLSQTIFSPDVIHSQLLSAIHNLLEARMRGGGGKMLGEPLSVARSR